MAPGVAHCGMDTDPYFEALVTWVENGTAPARITHQAQPGTTHPIPSDGLIDITIPCTASRTVGPACYEPFCSIDAECVGPQVSRTITRPLCPHPMVAVYKGTGSTDEQTNFDCGGVLPGTPGAQPGGLLVRDTEVDSKLVHPPIHASCLKQPTVRD